MYYDDFINAIHSMNKVKIKYFSKKYNEVIERVCAPMDYGISNRFKNNIDYYHGDYESEKGPHTLLLNPKDVQTINVLNETFDPAEFIDWTPIIWIIPRDWGKYS